MPVLASTDKSTWCQNLEEQHLQLLEFIFTVCVFFLVTFLPNSISQDGAITFEGDSTICEDPTFLSQVSWIAVHLYCLYVQEDYLCLTLWVCTVVYVYLNDKQPITYSVFYRYQSLSFGILKFFSS